LDGEALIDQGPEALKEAIPSLGKRLKLIAFLKTTQVCCFCTCICQFQCTLLFSPERAAADNSNPCLSPSTSSSSSSITNLADTSVTVTDVRITYCKAIQPIMTPLRIRTAVNRYLKEAGALQFWWMLMTEA